MQRNFSLSEAVNLIDHDMINTWISNPVGLVLHHNKIETQSLSTSNDVCMSYIDAAWKHFPNKEMVAGIGEYMHDSSCNLTFIF